MANDSNLEDLPWLLIPLFDQGWITIPTGAIIRVIAGPNDGGEQMIEVLWEDRMLAMYAIDVTAGCREITDRSATTGGRKKDDEGVVRRAPAK